MTPLARLLAERIRETGPITVADYMAECLLHPVHGYYTTRDPFGTRGDFTTAPEISQMFGELLGLALAQAWLDRGSSTRFTLAELGPGRGTLMADILRATRGVPGFHAAAQVVLVEASPHPAPDAGRRCFPPMRPDGSTGSRTCPKARFFSSRTNFLTPCRSASSSTGRRAGRNA
jgi:hypothetical protein